MERLVFNSRPISDRVDFLDLAGQYSLYHQSILVVLIECPVFGVRFWQPRISGLVELQILNLCTSTCKHRVRQFSDPDSSTRSRKKAVATGERDQSLVSPKVHH